MSENTKLPPEAQLKSAARLIDQALLQLDTRGAPCRCCGKPTFANRAHAKVYENLSDLPARLRHQARAVEEARVRPVQAGAVPTRGYEESVVAFHKNAEREVLARARGNDATLKGER